MFFFATGPVGDLGDAASPEVGCAMYCAEVGTSGACRDMRLDVRRHWAGPGGCVCRLLDHNSMAMPSEIIGNQ